MTGFGGLEQLTCGALGQHERRVVAEARLAHTAASESDAGRGLEALGRHSGEGAERDVLGILDGTAHLERGERRDVDRVAIGIEVAEHAQGDIVLEMQVLRQKELAAVAGRVEDEAAAVRGEGRARAAERAAVKRGVEAGGGLQVVRRKAPLVEALAMAVVRSAMLRLALV
jgi:hypothetical protein